MRKIFGVFLTIVLVINLSSKADEGMWLLSLVGKLNIQKMVSMGCNLTAEQIYSINQSSLKDAVVALDHGSCTAELVSADGLLLTNHHCGFGEIQAHSSVEHDYLQDGFWAMKREDELANPGKTVTFLIRMEDVTDQVLNGITADMDDMARTSKIREASSKIEKDAKGKTGYETYVRGLFESNKFYLFVTETFNDVRLVGAPPQSLGKFGGETDNWMWPRHTCDFSMFRVYCAPDGKPATYSKDNVPYRPKHFLPISLRGIGKNDFTMVMGFPGTTTRYRTSTEVKYIMDVVNSVRITAREAKLNIIRDFMTTSQKARIQYATKFARSTNYYKYSIGQNKGLEALNVIGKKQAIEDDFLKWANGSPERLAKYGGVLDSINSAFKTVDEKVASQYAREALLGGAEIFNFASKASPLYQALIDDDKSKIDAAAQAMRNSLDGYFKDYDANTDMKIAGALLEIYSAKVGPKYMPSFFEAVRTKYKGNFDRYAQKMFEKTIFADKAKMELFLGKPSIKVLEKDMAFIAMHSIFEALSTISEDMGKSTGKVEKARRLFVAGLNEMNKDKPVYPDANSTMRLTYGVVNGYVPRDATYYDDFTTLKGYKEKGIAGNADFDFPQKVADLYDAKDYGQYGDKDGTLHTCFISNNDITGGNSGSPVMNGNGELIGIAFDGNWEAMSGDIAYEPEIQKCINVDIRFVLWTIDKYAGAGHLIDEMMLIR